MDLATAALLIKLGKEGGELAILAKRLIDGEQVTLQEFINVEAERRASDTKIHDKLDAIIADGTSGPPPRPK